MTSLAESNDIQIEERRPGIWGRLSRSDCLTC